VPYGGEYTGLLVTEESSPLDPNAVEHKYYAKGIGFLLSTQDSGPPERIALTGIEKF
jgi:hypothetical protein